MEAHIIKDLNANSGHSAEITKMMDMIKKLSADFDDLGFKTLEFWKDNLPDINLRTSAVLHAHMTCLTSFLEGVASEVSDGNMPDFYKRIINNYRVEVLAQMQIILSIHKNLLDPKDRRTVENTAIQALKIKYETKKGEETMEKNRHGTHHRMDMMADPVDGLVAMSEGNPGCANVLGNMAQVGNEIDPKYPMGGLGHVMFLDNHQIYGSNVWVFYKDMCGQNIVRTIGAIRAVQMGLKPIEWVKDLIHQIQDPTAAGYPMDGVRAFRKDLDEVLVQVREQVEDFQKEDGEIIFPLPEERKAS